ncbi:MAG TPA: glycosyltransferase, partial [Candidatus Thermoplasmatota archaeon]|nr:glycosyltransferase [Candidatus Thermoplasmatota archaeon]
RWKELHQDLLPAIEEVRGHIGPIGFVGLWWDVEEPWQGAPHYHLAFRVDGPRLRRVGVQVRPPVPYTEVIPTMSQARVNIMTQRPLLRHLKHLTSKYFELFCADTIPLVMLDPDHAALVYGPAGRELALHDGLHEGIGAKLVDVLRRPAHYQAVVEAVRRHLATHHSYQHRVRELVAALQAPVEAPST